MSVLAVLMLTVGLLVAATQMGAGLPAQKQPGQTGTGRRAMHTALPVFCAPPRRWAQFAL